jgi:RNA polymerase sigma-70 factor (ECF subfamily)
MGRFRGEVLAMSAVDASVAAAIAGDRRALETVVARLLPRLRNLTRYLVRGDSDADDIAQEALVAVVRGLPSFRGEGSLESWADRVAVRETFACLRRARRVRERIDRSADLTTVPHPEAGPDVYAERRRTARLLDQLPDDQRHAVVLHHVLGLSVPEIAAQVGSPLETVRSRLRLGIARLRSLHADERAPRASGHGGGTR